MRTQRFFKRLTVILSVITLLAILAPAVPLPGQYTTLIVTFGAWYIVLPTAILVTLSCAALTTVLHMRAPDAQPSLHRRAVVAWGVLATVAFLVAFAVSGNMQWRYAWGGWLWVGSLLAIALGGLAAVGVVASRSTAAGKGAVWIAGTLVCLLALAGLIPFARQTELHSEYRRSFDDAVKNEKATQERQRENGTNLTVACGLVSYQADRLAYAHDTVRLGAPPVLPEELYRQVTDKTDSVTAAYTSLKQASCTETVAAVTAEIEANGKSLKSINWSSTLYAYEVDELRPPPPNIDASPLSFWAVTPESVAAAKQRLDRSWENFLRERDENWNATQESLQAAKQPPSAIISGELLGEVVGAAEAVIAAAGTDGTPEATGLRNLAALAAESLWVIPDDIRNKDAALYRYVAAARTMLDAAAAAQ